MTSTQICNLALGYLATPAIGDITSDTTPQGVLCRTFYASVKAALLEDRNWTFAMKTWLITKEVAAPVSVKYDAAYIIPVACVRVHRCDDGKGDYRIGWERIGQQVLADDSPASLYVEGVDGTCDEANFSNSFVFTLAAQLAVELCIPLTENATLWASLVRISEAKLKSSSGSDGRQGKSEKTRSDSLAQRR
jgi:hypothetical protein